MSGLDLLHCTATQSQAYTPLAQRKQYSRPGRNYVESDFAFLLYANQSRADATVNAASLARVAAIRVQHHRALLH